MLLRIDNGSATQRCDVCGMQHQIAWTALRAGVESEDPPTPLDPNVIRMPQCPGCSSTEFLIRVTRSDDSPDVPTLDHRRGVNALHAALVESGSVVSTLSQYFQSEVIASDRAPLPWAFAHEPIRPVAAALPDPATAVFNAFMNGDD